MNIIICTYSIKETSSYCENGTMVVMEIKDN